MRFACGFLLAIFALLQIMGLFVRKLLSPRGGIRLRQIEMLTVREVWGRANVRPRLKG